jgi:hypothetical protein
MNRRKKSPGSANEFPFPVYYLLRNAVNRGA